MTSLSPQALHILIALAEQDQHGYAIMRDVAARTNGTLRLSPGTLYGSIKRLLEDGLVTERRETPSGKAPHDDRRRYYRLTPLGRETAKIELRRMADLIEHAHAHGLTAHAR